MARPQRYGTPEVSHGTLPGYRGRYVEARVDGESVAPNQRNRLI